MKNDEEYIRGLSDALALLTGISDVYGTDRQFKEKACSALLEMIRRINEKQI